MEYPTAQVIADMANLIGEDKIPDEIRHIAGRWLDRPSDISREDELILLDWLTGPGEPLLQEAWLRYNQ